MKALTFLLYFGIDPLQGLQMFQEREKQAGQERNGEKIEKKL